MHILTAVASEFEWGPEKSRDESSKASCLVRRGADHVLWPARCAHPWWSAFDGRGRAIRLHGTVRSRASPG